ncbi:GGDEF domain-containing protein [Mesorhizobium sp. 1B3]|uniref:GGDEF domain-containing protein n=1 Tax=Mesorhizobium sp. 1B3 TaxID=3243599 RepID=UPI003D97F4EC
MNLDFPTLYVVILLNSLTLTVIWGAIAYAYHGFPAARHWLAANILTTTGGGLLAMQGEAFDFLLAAVGNGLVILGFGLVRTGVRRFFGRSGGWVVSILVTAGAVAALAAFGTSSESRNVIYATAQIVLVVLVAFQLLFREERSLGTRVAAVAMIVGILGQATEAVTNLMRIGGALSTDDYYRFAAVYLLAIIFAAVVWNFGFVLMAIDRLRSELATLAVIDELTGVPNRRGFMERAGLEEQHARRTGRPFSLLLLDLDNFKAINDNFGHAAGDASLGFFVRTAARLLPEQAMLGRLGGDEFCVLLPETDLQAAETVADDLVRLFRATVFRWKGQTIPLTVSIGGAEWSASDPSGVAGTIENADTALYETKSRGRDGCSIFRQTSAGAKSPVLLRAQPVGPKTARTQ